MAFPTAFKSDKNLMSMDAATAIHQFKLNYSKSMEFPNSITLSTFTAAGLNFEIRYYPTDCEKRHNYVGLGFALYCQSDVTVSFGFSFLDNKGMPVLRQRILCTFSPDNRECGFESLIAKSKLEALLLKDDCFTVVCSVTILNDSLKEVPNSSVDGVIPWSIDKYFAELLESKDMVDVTFEVEAESFTAHRLILSARSPVFKAELFGGMAESNMKTIKVKGIKPVVFKAMLHFIYTDTLLYMCDEDIPIFTLVQHLLEAADRYQLDGLKLICEERLIRDISMDSVISSLALAEEHSCDLLKNGCLGFAAEPENFVQLALKPEYVQLMQRYPSLLEDIGSFARKNGSFNSLVSKKQRTSRVQGHYILLGSEEGTLVDSGD